MPRAHLEIAIDGSTTPAYVQARVRAFVRGLGGGVRDEWSVAIAASEAATNIAKFAPRGTLSLFAHDGSPTMVELIAEDNGPGLDDIDHALRDGVSEGVDLAATEPGRRRRGLGTGLGAILRQMDALTIERRAGGGTRLIARRALRGV
ncbi:MAG TPA: ATP-binding protein [Kofleriaceae bacterium]|nr:ATP-binding protein [Kofleriaceae bacterium]